MTGSVELDESGRYNILFLTGRPVFWRGKTLKWLEDHEFPAAPVITAPDLHDADHVAQFKARIITQIQRLYPEARIGIGNAVTDSEAYTSRGMLAIMMDDGKHRRFGRGEHDGRRYDQHGGVDRRGHHRRCDR